MPQHMLPFLLTTTLVLQVPRVMDYSTSGIADDKEQLYSSQESDLTQEICTARLAAETEKENEKEGQDNDEDGA